MPVLKGIFIMSTKAVSSHLSFPSFMIQDLYSAESDQSLTIRVCNYFNRVLAALIQLGKRILGMDDAVINEDFFLDYKRLRGESSNIKLENTALSNSVKLLKAQVEVLTDKYSMFSMDRFFFEFALLPIKMVFLPIKLMLFPIKLMLLPLTFIHEELFRTHRNSDFYL